LTPASAGAETLGSFAAGYDPRDPGVSALADHGAPQSELAELGGQKQLLTPALVGAETLGLLLLDMSHLILDFQPQKILGSKVDIGCPASQLN
jgi:hypothetical protein